MIIFFLCCINMQSESPAQVCWFIFFLLSFKFLIIFLSMLHQNAEWNTRTVRWLKYWLLTCWGLKCLMFDHFLSLLHQNAAEWITRSVRCWPCQSCAWSWQAVGNHGGQLHSLHHPHIIILYILYYFLLLCIIIIIY